MPAEGTKGSLKPFDLFARNLTLDVAIGSEADNFGGTSVGSAGSPQIVVFYGSDLEICVETPSLGNRCDQTIFDIMTRVHDLEPFSVGFLVGYVRGLPNLFIQSISDGR
jgi:hypothetical protein